MTDDTPQTSNIPAATGKLAERVEQYIKLRDKKRALKAEYEAKNKPLAEMENLLSSSILRMLDEIGAENVRTKLGTAYSTVRSNASLADPDLFMQHVITTEQFDLLDRKANTTAVKEYVKEHGSLPPGCNLNSIRHVGVHKKLGGGPADND